MADYKKMYTTLFKSVTRAIFCLQDAQQQTEEIYLSVDEPNIKVIETIPQNTSSCVFCGATEKLMEYNNHSLCYECQQAISKNK